MDLLMLDIEAKEMLDAHDARIAHARAQNQSIEHLARLNASHSFQASSMIERRDALLAKRADLLASFRPSATDMSIRKE
jgi:hypothetical protein